jgi:membrane AbrB-like protein
MVTASIAALAGRPMIVPSPLAQVVYVVVGISLGGAVTPETVQGISRWPISIAILIAAMALVTTVTAFYLRIVHRWDPLSSLLAAAPGALSQVMALAVETGADLRAIAIVQSMRVVILTIGLPGGLALLGVAAVPRPVKPIVLSIDSVLQLGILIAVSALVGIALDRLRFRGGLIFGAMVASAALHGSGFTDYNLPAWAANGAMIVLGAIAGSRFANTDLRVLVHFIAAAFGSFLVSVAVVSLFVLAVVEFLGLRVADVTIAFAPGALDAMMILALALHLDPVYVGAHHLARFAFVSIMLPVAARWARKG